MKTTIKSPQFFITAKLSNTRNRDGVYYYVFFNVDNKQIGHINEYNLLQLYCSLNPPQMKDLSELYQLCINELLLDENDYNNFVENHLDDLYEDVDYEEL